HPDRRARRTPEPRCGAHVRAPAGAATAQPDRRDRGAELPEEALPPGPRRRLPDLRPERHGVAVRRASDHRLPQREGAPAGAEAPPASLTPVEPDSRSALAGAALALDRHVQ